jgi:hypothetical protein
VRLFPPTRFDNVAVPNLFRDGDGLVAATVGGLAVIFGSGFCLLN